MKSTLARCSRKGKKPIPLMHENCRILEERRKKVCEYPKLSNEKINEFLTAASQGDVQRVKHFVESEKINPNVTEPGGPLVTALGYAAENNQIEVVKLLLGVPKINLGQVTAPPWGRRSIRRIRKDPVNVNKYT
eukprot:986498_1